MDKAQQDALKKAAGIEAAKLIQNGMIAGLGTGSTVRFLVDELGRRVKEEGLEFTGVTTSRRTQEQAEGYGIKIVNIDDVDHIDVTIDGADEVDKNFNGIKGGGAALLWEKIVATNSNKIVWIVDESKVVDTIGKFPLPVEVIPFGAGQVVKKFEAKGYKTSLDIPAYTAEMGLDAFEYQCGHGVRLGVDKARRMAADAAERGILFSVHAPYYISMSSLEEEKRLGSVRYLLQSAEVCRALGGRRIIFHSGSCGKQSREAALEKALDTMRRAVEALDEAGYGDMTLCPETMGKIGQLGTLDEVLALCGVDKRITPCIDFGHLNARTLGGIQSRADYAAILDRMGEALGDERARRFHVHFSRIEFSAGGEKRHWTFAETQFGPEPQPLMELLAERRLEPVVICESAGTQAEDAQAMQRMYEAARGEQPLRQR